MKYQGRLVREDFGPGVWVLETDDGRRLTLAGDVPAGLVGKQVEVDGRVAEGMGFSMIGGELIEVAAIRRA